MKSSPPNPQSASFFVPVGLGVLAQMFCAGLVTAVTVFGFSSPHAENAEPQISMPGARERLNSNKPDSTAVANSKPDTESDTESDTNAEASATADNALAANRGPSPIEPGESEATPATVETSSAVPPEAQAGPLDDIRTRSRLLTIAGEGISDEIALCKILVTDVANVNMELIGGEFSKPQALTMEMEKQSVDDQSCSWSVRQVSEFGFARVQQVGEFQLKDQQLRFRWAKKADKGKLPFCRLKISAGSDMEVCELWSPVRAVALTIKLEKDPEKDRQRASMFVPPGIELPPAESLRLDFTLQNWPVHEASRNHLILNEPADIVFHDSIYDRDLLRIQLTLKSEVGQLAVQTRYFTTVPKSASRKAKDAPDYIEQQLKPEDPERLVKDMETETARYQKKLTGLDEDLRQLNAAQNKLDQQAESGFREGLPARQAALDARANDLAVQRRATNDLIEVYSDARSAMQRLTSVCAEIEERGRIHFQLVRPLDGGAPAVVVSSSMNAGVNEEARNIP